MKTVRYEPKFKELDVLERKTRTDYYVSYYLERYEEDEEGYIMRTCRLHLYINTMKRVIDVESDGVFKDDIVPLVLDLLKKDEDLRFVLSSKGLLREECVKL